MRWKAEPSIAFSGLWDVYDKDGNRVAEHKIKEVAFLIAAAPEMLDALKAAYDSIANDPDIYWKNDLLGELEQAIAKAEAE